MVSLPFLRGGVRKSGRLSVEVEERCVEVQRASQRVRAETRQYIFTKNLYKNPANPLT